MKQVTWRVGWYSKVVLTVMCLCLIASAYSFAQTPRDIAQKSFPSVVILVMEDTNSQPTALGSGFFVGENVVATNLHVIRNSEQGYVKIVGEKPKYDITGIVGMDTEMDLVLLQVANIKGSALPFGNSQRVAVGDEVYVIGNPQGLEGTFSQGIISGIRNFDTKYILQITAPISPGSSGGPVLNHKGRVVGVAVATLKGGQNLNFAIPAFYLSRLLTKLEPPIPLSSLPSSPKNDLFSKSLGENTLDAVIGENFAWEKPPRWEGWGGVYTFSLRNELRNAVADVYCYVIFYDQKNRPLDVSVVRYSGVIPGGLAKRIKGVVDESVKKMTTKYDSLVPHTKLEFRILDFKIVD